MHDSLPLVPIVILTAFIGCSRPHDGEAAAKQSVATGTNSAKLTEDEVLNIAKRELEAQETWADRATFKVERDGSEWRVFVQRHPIVFGGDRYITIDDYGNVIDYTRGL